jgi:hypothetical protein
MHELDAGIAGRLDEFHVDLVGQQFLDAFGPCFDRLAHGDPDVGVDEVDSLDSLFRILGQRDASPALLSESLATGDVRVVRPQCLRRANAHVHAQLRTDHQQGVTHVVAGVTEVRVADIVQRLVAVLPHGQHIGKHLGGMVFGRQPIEHRHTGVAC